MEKKGLNIGWIFVTFLVIVLGVVFLKAISDTTARSTNVGYTGYTNEVHNIASQWNTSTQPPYFWNVTDYYIELNHKNVVGYVLIKSSNLSNLTETTDFVMDRTNGKFYLVNSASVNGSHMNGKLWGTNLSYVTYNTYDEESIAGTSGATILGMVGLFFAIGVAVIILVYLKKEYWDGM